MLKLLSAVGLLLAAGAPAMAASRTPDEVVAHHIDALMRRDWNEFAKDLTPDSVHIGPNGITEGIPALHEVFKGLVKMDPPVVIEAKVVPAVGNIGIEDWVMNPNTPHAVSGRDYFVIRNGKITAAFTVVNPPAAPK